MDPQGKRANAAAGEMLRWQTDDRGVYLMAYIKVGAMADPLRSDPRFAELKLRIGLTPMTLLILS